MLKLTKKADYGLMAMKHLAEHVDQGACSAKDVAEAYGIPQEALAKILQRLAKVGLVRSQHGMNGGYTLTRDARMISAFEVIKARKHSSKHGDYQMWCDPKSRWHLMKETSPENSNG